MEDKKKQAFYFHDRICEDMLELRKPADALEMLVDKEMWPVPTYGDILFEV